MKFSPFLVLTKKESWHNDNFHNTTVQFNNLSKQKNASHKKQFAQKLQKNISFHEVSSVLNFLPADLHPRAAAASLSRHRETGTPGKRCKLSQGRALHKENLIPHSLLQLSFLAGPVTGPTKSPFGQLCRHCCLFSRGSGLSCRPSACFPGFGLLQVHFGLSGRSVYLEQGQSSQAAAKVCRAGHFGIF